MMSLPLVLAASPSISHVSAQKWAPSRRLLARKSIEHRAALFLAATSFPKRGYKRRANGVRPFVSVISEPPSPVALSRGDCVQLRSAKYIGKLVLFLDFFSRCID